MTVNTGANQILQSNVDIRPIKASGELETQSIIKVGSEIDNVIVDALGLVLTGKVSSSIYIGDLRFRFKQKSQGGVPLKNTIKIFMFKDLVTNKVTNCSKVSNSVNSASGGSSKGEYSPTCEDYMAKGWSNKDACMQDGCVHIAFEVNPDNCAPVSGSLDDLKNIL